MRSIMSEPEARGPEDHEHFSSRHSSRRTGLRPRRLLRPAVVRGESAAEGVPRRVAGAGQAGARLQQSAAARGGGQAEPRAGRARPAPSPTGRASCAPSRAMPRRWPSPSRSARKFRSTRSTTGRSAWPGALADLFSTRSRESPPPGLSDPAIAALKTFRLGERIDPVGPHGRDRRLGPVRPLQPVRQERCRQPPVPAGAALRGAHRRAGG